MTFNAFVALSWERKDLVAPARPAVSSCKPSSSSSSNFHHQNLTNNSIDKMAWRSSGSLSRSLISTLRPSSLRSTPSLPRLRPPPLPSRPGLQSRRFSFSPSRNLGELGCTHSLLPMLGTTCLTSHLCVDVRAFCELSHGTFYRTCQDR
ncbi:uncharacterized protein LOC101202763 isoform X1 [Cucumis sativus]|nr:uncharacterized protein LOC101202763 isoform X1 [Cucumis sativus]